MSSRYGCLFLAITLLVAATPLASAEEEEPDAATCIGYNVSRAGEGVGAYVAALGAEYAIEVASGVPEDGLTMTLLIGPTRCLGPSEPIGGLPPPPELGQSAPGLPGLPILP